MVNPMVLQMAASLLRYLFIVSGYAGLVSDEEITQIIGGVLTVGTIGWSIYKNYRDRRVLVTALAASALTEHEAQALVSNPQVRTPSVLTSKDRVPA